MPRGSSSALDQQEDARRLHEAGYSARAVWAKWALDEYATLHHHLTDGGEPVQDDAKIDSAFYLDAEEWSDVARAARRLADLAVAIADCRKRGVDR